jgi:hypothetical protein
LTKTQSAIVPVPAGAATVRGERSWARRHAWSLGGTFAVLTMSGLWWRRRRRLRASDLGPVTPQWLAEHEYDEGQRGSDDPTSR